MKIFWVNIKVILAYLLILSACTEMENPIATNEKVLKIETKWLADSNGVKKLKIYNKEYDKQGKLIKITEYDSLGQAQKIHNYKYTDSSLTETIEYLNAKDSSSALIKMYCSSTKEGKIISKVEVNFKGDTLARYEFKYDLNGNLVSTIKKYTQSKNTTITEYKYNSAGSLANTIIKDYTTGTVIKADSLIYNYEKQTIDKVTLDDSGNIKTIISASYNKFGKVYKEIENDPNNKIINTYIYEYMYY